MKRERLLAAASDVEKQVVGWRREIHRHPELAYDERRTSALVERELGQLGLDVIRTGLASTGVAALLRGGAAAGERRPVVLLRADMDALPIQEATDLPFASAVGGAMHACGHDAHTAMLLGAASLLARLRSDLPVDVLFMFQPAEEGGAGAKRMLEAGLFEIAHPDAAYMLHVWHELPAGIVAIPSGPAMAGALTFEIEIRGRGGHAARPHLALDPVVAAANVVTVLQALVSREMDPAQAVVITIGSIQAGTAANVIPDTALIKGTARAYEASILDSLRQRISEVVTHSAAALRMTASVEFRESLPPLVNHPLAAQRAARAVGDALGPDSIGVVSPSMGSEDFAYVLERVPGAMVRLGVRAPHWDQPRPIHTPTFDLDETALKVGVVTLAALAFDHGPGQGRHEAAFPLRHPAPSVTRSRLV